MLPPIPPEQLSTYPFPMAEDRIISLAEFAAIAGISLNNTAPAHRTETGPARDQNITSAPRHPSSPWPRVARRMRNLLVKGI
jgi:hypothetical protein